MWFLCVFWLLQKNNSLLQTETIDYDEVLSGLLMDKKKKDWILKKGNVTNRCVFPCMASQKLESLLENKRLTTLQLVCESFKGRGSPCSRVSLFRAFKARNLFFICILCQCLRSSSSLPLISLKVSLSLGLVLFGLRGYRDAEGVPPTDSVRFHVEVFFSF